MKLPLNELSAEFEHTAGESIRLQASRSHETTFRDGIEATLSEEAFDALIAQVRLWVGTRMTRHHARTGRGAQHVEVEVTVKTTAPMEMGGEPITATVELVRGVDGRLRVRNARSVRDEAAPNA